jgi:hypothetical protein
MTSGNPFDERHTVLTPQGRSQQCTWENILINYFLNLNKRKIDSSLNFNIIITLLCHKQYFVIFIPRNADEEKE